MSNRSIHLLTPSLLLRAYAMGIFPMAESAESLDLHWYDPPVRALIPLDDRFHIPRRLARTIRKHEFEVTINRAFGMVIRACATPATGRETTWINKEIIRLYTALHARGHAHSIGVWRDNKLVGGLYGVSLGRAFFGESMFSRETDASKIALVHLVTLLRSCGYKLLDTQFMTDHLARFGTFEVTRTNYQHMLAACLRDEAAPFPVQPDWNALGL